jgi:hypothetical protein
MKLYTEEKLRASMLSMITYIKMYDESVIDKIVENHIKALGGVELPSDEEIEQYVNSTPYYGSCTPEYCEGIEDGIQWVLNKIQGGNNENKL